MALSRTLLDVNFVTNKSLHTVRKGSRVSEIGQGCHLGASQWLLEPYPLRNSNFDLQRQGLNTKELVASVAWIPKLDPYLALWTWTSST